MITESGLTVFQKYIALDAKDPTKVCLDNDYYKEPYTTIYNKAFQIFSVLNFNYYLYSLMEDSEVLKKIDCSLKEFNFLSEESQFSDLTKQLFEFMMLKFFIEFLKIYNDLNNKKSAVLLKIGAKESVFNPKNITFLVCKLKNSYNNLAKLKNDINTVIDDLVCSEQCEEVLSMLNAWKQTE